MKNKKQVKINSKAREVKFERHYPGYVYRREIIDVSDTIEDMEEFEMINCYSSDTGDYLGDAKMARFLCDKKGLRNIQKINSKHCICSIGFNEKEQKWYGWSHRAFHGFGIGSEIKKGNCGYMPANDEDFIEDCIRFWSDDCHKDIKTSGIVIHENRKGVWVSWKYSDDTPNKKLVNQISSVFCPVPDKYGRGEWVAKTLNDAKQMAIDFASKVS